MEDKEEQKLPEFTIKFNHEAKLKELLRNLTSVEIKLCADASKEFISILNSDLGSDFIGVYVKISSNLIEISQAWESRRGKPGFSHILDLISAIFKHCNHNAGDDGSVNARWSLDMFARKLVEEKMGDLYKELNSKEGKRQNAVLLLLASIVRRNSHLAWEVAKVFDFKLTVFPKLAEVRLRAKESDVKRKSDSTRKSFVAFGMSFLEVGHPRLLRGILQQKEMYSGLLRGLGNDGEETVVYVLSVLRDKILVPESLVPPGLRSVLFGSVTLEQLVKISERDDFTDGAELAHDVLIVVCTNPENGLMPDLERQPSPLRGNQKRLLDLMKKLKATEVKYHKSLLLAIVKGRPSFGSAYLDELPYNLEDLASPNWFVAISLAGDVVASVNDGLSFGFGDKSPEVDSVEVQNILKCIGPRPFTRSVINKGLLHSDFVLKHGTLRLVLEVFKLLDSFLNNVDHSLKIEIQNGVRMLLPDPQVLLSLLPHLNNHFKSLESTTKRKAETENVCEHDVNVSKRRKSYNAKENTDIFVGGVDSISDYNLSGNGIADMSGEKGLENEADIVKGVGGLWGLQQCSMMLTDIKNGDIYFYSKLLDTFKLYYRTMPMALEGLFDLFKLVPSNPLSLPSILLQSLLNLLNEQVSQSSKDVTPIRMQPQMYKHLNSFMVLMLYSPSREIREQSYMLAKKAMFTCGAFDNIPREICAWFFFIPCYSGGHIYAGEVEVEIFQKLSSVIVSFLCDAVATMGNNLYKYMELMRRYIFDSEGGNGLSPGASPFVICVLEKCIRLLISESGSFTLPQKSLISLYVCNTVKYLLDTQVNAGPLSFLIHRVLSEKLANLSNGINDLELVECPCEWRPLKALFGFSRDLLNRQCYSICSNVKEVAGSSNPFLNTLSDIKKVIRSEYDVGLVGLMVGFSFSLLCTSRTELLQNLPFILSISNNSLKAPLSVLASIFFLESNYLSDVSKSWPEMFFTALESVVHIKEKKEEIFDRVNLDSTEAASVAFANYLKRSPVWVLFSSIIQSSSLHLFDESALQKLLLDKLTDIPSDHLVSSLCNVLFWMNHARSFYSDRSFNYLEIVSRLCSVLAEHLLKQLLVEKVDSVLVVEVTEIILNHPIVTASLSCPLIVTKEFSDSVFKETPEALWKFGKQGVHTLDQNVMNLVKTVIELLLPMCNGPSLEQASNGCKQISRTFEALVQSIFQIFKNKFDGCIKSNDFTPLVPTFYALYTLMRLISPFKLLELVNWSLSQIDFKDSTSNLQSKETALSVCLHLAWWTFDCLSGYMWQSYIKLYYFLDRTGEINSDAMLFERTFLQILEIACRLNLDIADMCLLKAVKVVKLHKCAHGQHLFSIMVLSRVMACAPLNIVSHCLNRINRTKAELLYLITEISPLHLSGPRFSEILDKSSLSKAKLKKNTSESFSDEEIVMLLPTVFLYLNSTLSKFGGQLRKPYACVLSVYGRILLGGFSDWKTFIRGNISEMGLDETLPKSKEEYLNLFSKSLLGMAILMVRDHLALAEELMNFERRFSLFNSVCPLDSGNKNIFDDDIGEIGLYSLKQSLEFVNGVVAKINFCRMLLLLDYNKFQSESQRGDSGDKRLIPLEVNPDMEKSRIRFLKMLINSWRWIVKKFSENFDYTGNPDGPKVSPFKFLEIFLISNISDLAMEMRDCLVKLSSLHFIEKLVISSLLYRFGDHVTLKMLRTVLSTLFNGKFSIASVIQKMVAHSQFAKSIHMSGKSLGTQFGLIFTPMRSILRSLVISRTSQGTPDSKICTFTSQRNLNLLELVKLIRVLLRMYAQQTNGNFKEDIGINSTELIYLLLSSSGATCSEVDMEIYDLIQEIESNDKSSAEALAQIDYLWGIASLKVMKDWEHDKDIHSVDLENTEAFEEQRKFQFRENLPIDPKLCAQTVLYFPYFRFVNVGTVRKLFRDNSAVMQEASCTLADNVQVYDPVFILRFSLHCLSRSYIEPIEFASLGLLAVTFVSISSPHDDMRKLGYEVLAKFKNALEKCQKKKDVRRILLLLSHLQNGIEQPWQRIPSVITVFLAEASLVLLDPSHDNYSAVSKYLMNSPSVNLKGVPLFQQFFWSSSVSFKAERLWMLQLLYVGLNTEVDAQIYINNSIFDVLISFYSSPLSDNDSKELIIQIVKKSVQLYETVWVLVQHCGLILWLSSIVSSLCGSEFEDRNKFTFTLLPTILEMVIDITSHKTIVEWLRENALEQLSELSSHLFQLLVGGVELFKEQTIACNSILQILTLVLKISQKRKIYQPHFTLSDEGVYKLYEVVEACYKTRSDATMVLGLEAVLMSSPPLTLLQMDQEKLLKFLRWAVTTVIQSKSTKLLQREDSNQNLIAVSGQELPEESLISKLLRWLTASVILGKVSSKLSELKSGSFFEKSRFVSWQSLLECHHEKGFDEKARYGNEEILAVSIFYLLQLLGFSYGLVPSVVHALCLLLLPGSSVFSDGSGSYLSLLYSKIHCPAEVYPAWRWSFYQPWSDPSLELNDLEKLDEIQACEKILIVTSNILLKKCLGSERYMIKDDVDEFHEYDWERNSI